MFKAAKREEGGRGGVPFQFQQRPVDAVDCARRELGTKRCPFFSKFSVNLLKWFTKGETKSKSKVCLPDPRILSVCRLFA